MKDVVIAGYCRSPFTPAKKGRLAGVRPDELAAQVIRGLVRKTGVNPNDIEDLILGCAFPEAEQGLNLGRLLVFLAGLPIGIAGTTLNRFCGSSMQAIHQAAGAIQLDAGEAFICAGVESMSRVPMTGYNPMPHPRLYKEYPEAYMSMGETAENLVERFRIGREEQERFALESQRKIRAAREAGRFADEIIPIATAEGMVSEDGCPRPDTTPEALAGLKPAFRENGAVTAGTSSPMTDGAAAVLVCSANYAEKNGLHPLARIRSIAVAGCAPEVMGLGPVEAICKALQRVGLGLEDIDFVELNEAFVV